MIPSTCCNIFQIPCPSIFQILYLVLGFITNYGSSPKCLLLFCDGFLCSINFSGKINDAFNFTLNLTSYTLVTFVCIVHRDHQDWLMQTFFTSIRLKNYGFVVFTIVLVECNTRPNFQKYLDEPKISHGGHFCRKKLNLNSSKFFENVVSGVFNPSFLFLTLLLSLFNSVG